MTTSEPRGKGREDASSPRYEWFTRQLNPHLINVYQLKDGVIDPESRVELDLESSTLLNQLLNEAANLKSDDFGKARQVILAGFHLLR